ncbi:chitinase A1 [Lindgomyces ingoldianus]|uniref:Chitinase A1 n=1 Tax=Lindgomyces ingoldianus TaxID=673940 RepID=A0ACB6R5E1_9PLEO|nr:chitinase A1 [Lindgomyces ingoldianus]KAF2473995.1 chitinase A1 [Lindgomyces ingoldianus]
MTSTLSLRYLLALLLTLSVVSFVSSQQGATCDAENKCKVGCCSKQGSCGFGDDWCAPNNCIGTCNATAECGQWANPKGKECPLKVCCSRWGFCGTTEEFCATSSNRNESCQSNCAKPERKKCASSWRKRRIAYYESWADTRDCDSFRPEDIPVHALTHINIAFGGISSDFKVTIDSSGIISRVVKLKRQNPALQVILSIGGWTFTDPGPTRDAWTNMAASSSSRETFAKSVVETLEKYALDGIDLDWEYPEADDRGGHKADFDNYVYLLRAIKSQFDDRNPSWTLSVAIPASYWYLQHFDVNSMQSEVDWFNMMTYDQRGKWDQNNPWTGPYVFGHTNVTEIESGLDLLRRNDVDLSKVNLGTGFYGRTFTLADSKCNTPGCVFADAGAAGECSGERGILSFKEIMARSKRLNDKKIVYENATGVTYMVYDDTQWITYDDAKSFAKKRELLDSECLGGVMIWAIDQDTPDFQALSALLGDEFVTGALIEGGTLSDEEKDALAQELGGLTGDGCYVTMGCSGPGSSGKFNTCAKGDIPIERLHAPGGAAGNVYSTGNLAQEIESCAKGQWKTVCCSPKSPAVNCKWVGAPERSSFYCDGGFEEKTCGDGRYELVTDQYTTYEGGAKCASGARSLCCDAASELQQCHWSDCQTELKCPSGGPLTYRGNEAGGKPCPKGQYQSYCCPIAGIYQDCQWKPNVPTPEKNNGQTTYFSSTMQQCMDTKCPKGQVTIAKATLPERPAGLPAPCMSYNPGIEHLFCCDPLRNVTLPFDVKKIFPHPHGFDVVYEYKDNYGNNDHDPHGPDETDVGDDPYGFVLLDGDEGALQGNFPRDYVFVHDDDGTGNPIKRRETLTRDDPDLMDWTFEHEEGTHLVYCRSGREEHCEKIFMDNAYDTIIALPRHIGSGPFARVVSMDPVDETELPPYHIRKRSAADHTSRVYKLVFDYHFENIRREDQTVNIRIDYTNLVPYWDDMTGTESPKGTTKRSRHEKRFWGELTDWLKQLTRVQTSDQGKLPMSLHKRMLLYRKRAQCARGNTVLKAGLDVTLDAKFDMNARWAYYAQGTIVPLNVEQIYAYFEMEPVAQATLEVEGNAEIEYRMKERLKIIDTLSYPGLAIKGIAAIGPTLDVYGEMRAKATVAGKLKAGAKITFPRYEIYFPQVKEAEARQKFDKPAESAEQGSKGTDFEPILDASVQASVGVDLLITPEVNLGIKVNTPSVKGDIVNAQIVGFINNTFRFEVIGKGQGGIGNTPAISYDIFIKYLYNFGIGGTATFKWLGNYALKPLQLWNQDREKILYEHHGQVSIGKRNPFISDGEYKDDFSPLYNSTYWFDEDWHSTRGALSPLQRREEGEEASALNEKATSFFTCNDGGQCPSGACAGDACQWVPGKKPPSSRTRRADPEEGDPMDTDPVVPCMNSIPAFMYNCKFFVDEDLGHWNGPFPGICTNIMNFFTSQGLGSGPFTGSFSDSGSSGEGSNRENVCGSRSTHTHIYTNAKGEQKTVTETWSDRCIRESNEFATATSRDKGEPGNRNWLSCDEFPFNSLNEGGNSITNSRACVPGYEQETQGTINGLPRRISQTVTWADSAGNEKSASKPWTQDWLGANALYGSGGRQGSPNKDSAWNWAYNNRKDFTFHLFNSDTTTTPQGGSYQVFNHQLKSGDIATVVGAFNLMDNPKYSIAGGKNAYCTTGGTRSHDLWGTAGGRFVRVTLCTVEFDNAAAASKIKRGEQPTEEEMFKIKNIEIADDEEEFEIPIGGFSQEPGAEATHSVAEEGLSTTGERQHHHNHYHRHAHIHRSG